VNAASRTATSAPTLWVLLLAGCSGGGFQDMTRQADLSSTEGTLQKAGFEARPASTQKREAQLLALPPYTLVRQPHDGEVRYVFADAAVCDCLYVGDEAAYHRYRDLALAQRIAVNDALDTGQASSVAVFDWGTWETASQ
jgi:hypothetical protein